MWLIVSQDAQGDVDSKHNRGRTVLGWAAIRGHLEVVRMLLNAKAAVDYEDGRTA